MNYSYIINYRKRGSERHMNLITVLRHIEDFNNIEIVLIEQDDSKKIDDSLIEDYNIKYKFVYNDGEFNRSWGFNVGSKIASHDILIFSDADLLITEDKLVEGIKKINEGYECVSPYNNVIDITYDEKMTGHFDKWITIMRPNRGGINLTGGLIIYDKEAFMKIGGWYEKFRGWGGEDDFMTWKSNKYLKCLEMEGKIVHLFHKKAPINHEQYKKNLRILQHLHEQVTRERLIKEIEESDYVIGDIYKYTKQEINND